MTPTEIQSIKEIEGTAGFRVIEFLVQQKIKELNSVEDLIGIVDVSSHALAKAKAVKLLKEFISDLQLNPVSDKETRRTFE